MQPWSAAAQDETSGCGESKSTVQDMCISNIATLKTHTSGGESNIRNLRSVSPPLAPTDHPWPPRNAFLDHDLGARRHEQQVPPSPRNTGRLPGKLGCPRRPTPRYPRARPSQPGQKATIFFSQGSREETSRTTSPSKWKARRLTKKSIIQYRMTGQSLRLTSWVGMSLSKVLKKTSKWLTNQGRKRNA